MPRLAVLGEPIAHSRSPVMHSAALEELGLAGAWTYEAIEVPAEEFDGLVRSLAGRGFAGVNVTVPHKLRALALADEASVAAREVGAANTLTFAKGRITADNTDVIGIADAFPGTVRGARALVLGAGGSARAAVWALREAGADVAVWNRTAERAAALAAEMGVEAASGTAGFKIWVNATTVGMDTPDGGHHLAEARVANLKDLPIADDGLDAEVVMDLAYGKRETALIEAARQAGARTVDGLEVLARQGAASLRIWTGESPSLETMLRAARG